MMAYISRTRDGILIAETGLEQVCPVLTVCPINDSTTREILPGHELFERLDNRLRKREDADLEKLVKAAMSQERCAWRAEIVIMDKARRKRMRLQ